MTGKSVLYALAVLVLTGSMAVAVMADEQGMDMYGPADSSVSGDVGTGESQVDAWDLREAMETGSLPGQTVGSYDDSEIHESAIESGGQLFRPEIDVGP